MLGSGHKMLKARIFVHSFILPLCLSAILLDAQLTDPSEVDVLHAVKRSLHDSRNYLLDWGKGDACTSNWTGISCTDAPGVDGYFHILEVELLNKNLSGNLVPELGKLTQLEILNFMWNGLTGGIPKEIGNLASLKLLLLNGNKLSGSLPEELGNLVNLTRIQVDENQISGPIPNSFAKLSNLRHLHMNNNSISGQIPVELKNVSTLIHILLDNNNLTGNLPPELSETPELRILQLDNNNFDGSEIPASYGNFTKLIKLSLRNCSLMGTVPDLSGITNLTYIDLSRNNLTGPIPSSELSDKITTIDLSRNHLNGPIPASFSNLPSLQNLSLENNQLTGAVLASIWVNRTFSAEAKLLIDLQDNLLSSIEGELNPPRNVTLRLGGNPLCNSANISSNSQFCISDNQGDGRSENSLNSTCPTSACPTDNYYEYVPESPVCFCASPIRIGYQLKSPSISYFPPYSYQFRTYLTSSLGLELYQLSIDSLAWEEGPRLNMYLKIFPALSNGSSHILNASEVLRIRHRFIWWHFPNTDLFGPYDLLNFTLLGPYSTLIQAEKTGINKGVLAAISLGAVACAVSVSALITVLILRRTKDRQLMSRKNLSSRISVKIDGVKAFTVREMALATDNFNSAAQVGQGGYGKVYKGILSDTSAVAVKRAEEGSLQGQREFLTEIKLLSRLHHRNLVSLIGYCDEDGEQMLVYEFMPNGTLRDWISGKAKEYLNFGRRLHIALGAAKGILYLHTEANPPVFHRDIKASNILLDSKLTAKVADFGLSRLAPVLDDEGAGPHYVSTIVRGTPGYLDPEYFLTHKLTDKSDVYSLGVVFLEILTGMQPISHGKNIVREVNMAHQSGMMFSIIDSKMGSYPSECIEKFVTLALTCCDDKPENRPSVLDVVRELECVLKTMPETTDTSYSDTASMLSMAASSSSYPTGGQYVSLSTVSGSDLISGVVPTIEPR